MTPVLDIRHLSVAFPAGRRWVGAVDDVSLTVAAGEILALVGESGAGKSVLGAAIIGLLEPPGRMTGGTIWLDGQRIDNLGPAAMRHIRGRRISAIFQDPLTALDPLYTVGRQLTETIKVHLGLSGAAARARTVSWLQEMGFDQPASRFDLYPHQLSGGMRQRVVIALALCGEPRLVIADEPTTALDVSVQAQIIALLARLAAGHGTAFLLITHDIGVAGVLADRVAVLYAGRVVETGDAADVLQRPVHPYTQGLIACVPSLDVPTFGVQRLRQIEGTMPGLGKVPPGCPFSPRCPHVFDRCRVERPELMPAGDSLAACWLYD